MHPELFEIPFTNGLTVKSYGLMMVIGFLLAVTIIRKLSKNITPDSQMVTNAALYALIAGIVGARVFYVLHYFGKFRGDLLSVFAIWEGGLELLGGVLFAMTVIILYLRFHKLPVRRYLDILAVGLMVALAFGRIGCLLNGCCFGKPANLPWAISFPYGSFSFNSQIYWNPERNRIEPQLILPGEFSQVNMNEHGITPYDLKPLEKLTEQQKQMVKKGGKYCALGVHPTQLYSSAAAFICAFILYRFRERNLKAELKNMKKILMKPGSAFAAMLILYAVIRFSIEFLRDDNPYEFDHFTISQNIAIAMFVLGLVLMVIFQKLKNDKVDVTKLTSKNSC